MSSFSLAMASLDPSGITGHQLQHGAMSHWQHSFKGKALMSKQCPTWSSLQAPPSASKQQFVTKIAGCHNLKLSIESLPAP